MQLKNLETSIPARGPNESPADYLKRLREYEDQEKQIGRALKDLNRRERLINNTIDRVLIEKQVRSALRGRERRTRFYDLPKEPGALLIFLPLYLLLSIVWQNVTHTDPRMKKGFAIVRGDDIK